MENFDIEDFMNRITIYQYSALNQDGSKLAYISNLSGQPQVWVGGIEPQSSQLLFPKPVTHEKHKSPHVLHPSLAWIGHDRLAITLDQHGDEKTFIEILNFKTGEIESLPRGEGRDFLCFVSEDQSRLFFTSNRAVPSVQSLYVYHLKSRKIELLHQPERNATWHSAPPWQGSYFFSTVHSNQENHLHALNLKTKKVTTLFDQPETLIEPVVVLPKNRLLVVTNHKRQFLSLALLDLKNFELTYLEKDKWDVELAKITRDQKHLFVSRNVAGKSLLERYSLPSLKRIPISFKTDGVISSLDCPEKTQDLVIGFSSHVEPKNFYRLNLKSKKLARLTDTWTSRIPQKKLARSKLITYPSERCTIHSWLFLPAEAKKNSRTPVIVWPHGGPQWQERASFRAIFQYFVARGFAVWAPNPTGSTGYGKDFTEAICGQWGTADLPDMIHGIDWLKNSGWIDPERIAIMGGSYGGYMTLRSITKIAGVFKAAVDIFGVSNLFTFVQSVPDDWKPFMDKMVGHPEKDADKLKEQSPAFSLDQISCPLLVIQGARDPRVVKSESDQVVAKLKELNKTVEYLVFEDEGHGFFKLENELKAYKAAAEFIEKYV